ncbi:MAG: type I glyceraldehyde-3-phosphate dehydrogenase [Candidatus Desulforudaceae bacterium]
MAVRLGINGFGRIGGLVLRAALSRTDVEVVAVNHKSRRLAVTEDYTSRLAHSFKYDSVHGCFPGEVSGIGDSLTAGGQTFRVFAEKDPTLIPWGDLGADVVVESTGAFTDATRAALHLESGAKKVIISAPSKNADLMVVMGVNQEDYDPAKHRILSNASCTTNCLAPVAKILHRKYGIIRGFMNTVHAYTNGQQLLDMPYKDPRRGRAAAVSMIPTTTGAAAAVGLVFPELAGRLTGFCVRVPVPNVSLIDLVVDLEQKVTPAQLNQDFKDAASSTEFKGILDYSDLPLVSTDYNSNAHSATVDGLSTAVIQDTMAKVLAWYDNEWGYSNRVVDLALYIASRGY